MFSRTKHKDKKHYCMSCLKNVTTEEILSNHKRQSLLIMVVKQLSMNQGQ